MIWAVCVRGRRQAYPKATAKWAGPLTNSMNPPPTASWRPGREKNVSQVLKSSIVSKDLEKQWRVTVSTTQQIIVTCDMHHFKSWENWDLPKRACSQTPICSDCDPIFNDEESHSFPTHHAHAPKNDTNHTGAQHCLVNYICRFVRCRVILPVGVTSYKIYAIFSIFHFRYEFHCL